MYGKREEWIVYSDFKTAEEYLDCYIWLTTTCMSDVAVGDKMYSGLSIPFVSFKFYSVNNPSKEIKEKYWENLTWIAIDSSDSNYMFKHLHYKILNRSDEKYPPIPKHLVELYNKYKNSVD